MQLSDEVLPRLLASKVVAARNHLDDVVDGIGVVMAEIGFRDCALLHLNYQVLSSVNSESWFAELEQVQGKMSLMLACVSGLAVLHLTRFDGVAGSAEELFMRNYLKEARKEAYRIFRFWRLLASLVRIFECLAKRGVLWEQSTREYAQSALNHAKVVCRLVQSLAGIMKFELEAVENTCRTGQLLPQPNQS